jgi:hypothetical protein
VREVSCRQVVFSSKSGASLRGCWNLLEEGVWRTAFYGPSPGGLTREFTRSWLLALIATLVLKGSFTDFAFDNLTLRVGMFLGHYDSSTFADVMSVSADLHCTGSSITKVDSRAKGLNHRI